jgi:biopolymer transport protein ExbB/TolQ
MQNKIRDLYRQNFKEQTNLQNKINNLKNKKFFVGLFKSIEDKKNENNKNIESSEQELKNLNKVELQLEKKYNDLKKNINRQTIFLTTKYKSTENLPKKHKALSIKYPKKMKMIY